MLIILPDKMDAVKDLENLFLKNSKNYAYLRGNMSVHNVELDVPKFKFESDLNLEKTLEKVSTKNIVTYIYIIFFTVIRTWLVNVNVSFVCAKHLDGCWLSSFTVFFLFVALVETMFFLLQSTNRKFE